MLKEQYRWILLLVGSILFYMAWKAEYILLLTGYVIVNYWCAIKIEDSIKLLEKKMLFYFAVFNIGILFVFKYFNFLIVT
ncbi:MAG: hypothetical protein IPP71_23645 [Bacteroidetes bacterium]|nr:hypothetical protein [Bacteroidota bacterium]